MNYTSRAQATKAFNHLQGIVEGISIDGVVNSAETIEFKQWLEKHHDLGRRDPYKDLITRLRVIVEDDIIDPEEVEDMRWLCKQVSSSSEYFEYYDRDTADLQKLQGMCHGIVADGVITEEEVNGIAEWIGDHAHLHTYYPYDEVVSVLTDVLSDGVIDEEERLYLLGFFHDFVNLTDDDLTEQIKTLTADHTRAGICAVDPIIEVEENTFVLTGDFDAGLRKDVKKRIENFGARVTSGVSAKTNYLVVGAKGQDCWAYACYGRKIEAAMNLRKKGANIVIVHENDLVDWLQDHE